MENLAASPWLLVVAGGAIVLALGIAYGMMRTRRRSRAEERQTEAGTREIYRKADRGEQV